MVMALPARSPGKAGAADSDSCFVWNSESNSAFQPYPGYPAYFSGNGFYVDTLEETGGGSGDSAGLIYPNHDLQSHLSLDLGPPVHSRQQSGHLSTGQLSAGPMSALVACPLLPRDPSDWHNHPATESLYMDEAGEVADTGFPKQDGISPFPGEPHVKQESLVDYPSEVVHSVPNTPPQATPVTGSPTKVAKSQKRLTLAPSPAKSNQAKAKPAGKPKLSIQTKDLHKCLKTHQPAANSKNKKQPCVPTANPVNKGKPGATTCAPSASAQKATAVVKMTAEASNKQGSGAVVKVHTEPKSEEDIIKEGERLVRNQVRIRSAFRLAERFKVTTEKQPDGRTRWYINCLRCQKTLGKKPIYKTNIPNITKAHIESKNHRKHVMHSALKCFAMWSVFAQRSKWTSGKMKKTGSEVNRKGSKAAAGKPGRPGGKTPQPQIESKEQVANSVDELFTLQTTSNDLDSAHATPLVEKRSRKRSAKCIESQEQDNGRRKNLKPLSSSG